MGWLEVLPSAWSGDVGEGLCPRDAQPGGMQGRRSNSAAEPGSPTSSGFCSRKGVTEVVPLIPRYLEEHGQDGSRLRITLGVSALLGGTAALHGHALKGAPFAGG